MSIDLPWIWVFLALYTSPIRASPIRNVTITEFGSNIGSKFVFASEPYGRGSFGIILSCTATFGFCIWTVVHPNIIPNTTWKFRLLYKVILMMIAVFIPEALIMFAGGQWVEARKIRNQWRKLYMEEIASDPEVDIGMAGAFFVVMGGLVVEERKIPNDEISIKNSWIPGRSHPTRTGTFSRWFSITNSRENQATATLTASGFMRYAKDGHIRPETINVRSMLDKGKSSVLAKVLAGTQALWLCAQCVTRWAQGLPITLLEVHIIIQVLATLVIYGFWWQKPLDVNEPIKIELLCTDSTLLTVDKSIATGISDTFPTHQATGAGAPENSKDPISMPELDLNPLRTIHNRGSPGRYESKYIAKQRPPRNIAAMHSKVFYEMLCYVDVHHDNTKSAGFASWTFILVEALLVALVGALHALAWNFHFPTPVEGLLWKLSSIAMCLVPLLVVFVVAFTKDDHKLRVFFWEMQFENKKARKQIGNALKFVHTRSEDLTRNAGIWGGFWYYLHYTVIFLIICFILIMILGYACSIVYITLESYISLRNPPDGTFLTPVWSNYWPHVG